MQLQWRQWRDRQHSLAEIGNGAVGDRVEMSELQALSEGFAAG